MNENNFENLIMDSLQKLHIELINFEKIILETKMKNLWLDNNIAEQLYILAELYLSIKIKLNSYVNNMINGFLFGFTDKFYKKYKREDEYIFNSDKEYIWNANECEFQLRLWKKGVKSYIIGACWIYHEKIRAWKYHFGERKSKKDYDDLSEKKALDYEQNWKEKMEQLPFEGGSK